MLKVLLASAAAALLAVPAASAVPQAVPLPGAAAQALAGRPPARAPGATRGITGQTALAAANVPGAFTEIAPGLTPRQAVGLDPTGRHLARRFSTTTCWNNSTGDVWGGWPYDRHLTDFTSWCGNDGVLTYRSSHANQTQTLCNPNGAYGFKIAGGAGETYVAFREGGRWGCPTDIPWFTLYFDNWMDIYVNGSGAYFIYEDSGA